MRNKVENINLLRTITSVSFNLMGMQFVLRRVEIEANSRIKMRNNRDITLGRIRLLFCRLAFLYVDFDLKNECQLLYSTDFFLSLSFSRNDSKLTNGWEFLHCIVRRHGITERPKKWENRHPNSGVFLLDFASQCGTRDVVGSPHATRHRELQIIWT